MGRVLVPSGGNDKVMTPEDLAVQIINHFAPRGRILEPCRGSGNFYRNFPVDNSVSLYCEIDEGLDFFDFQGRVDWVITNPPFSKFRSFLQKSMEVADHVVFLSFVNAFWMKARMRDIRDSGFGFKELILVDTPVSTGWPQSGFQCGVVHLERGYKGNLIMSDWRK